MDFFLSTWRADPIALGAIFAASVAYLLGVRRVRRRGEPWPLRRTIGFFALGLLPYAVIELGFLGTFSADLRWAFSTRIALLIFAVPAGIAAGRPLDLVPARVRERVLASRVTRVFGNAMVATIVIAAVFCLFLTPLAGILRVDPVVDASLGVVVPLVGLAMVLPMMALGAMHTGTFIAIEFLLAFVELLIDSVPGLLLRLNDSVLDLIPDAAQAAAWWPSPLHDQHLAGDMIWFIAEFADVPILVILMIRWMRSDRVEAKGFDDLSDEEYDEMTRAHLRGER
ncbi:cytochrome c oxidase assembly protein [Microbacterium sp. BWR-S6Y]|uniref:cytochrome c oxidase assembly protein n=1 Tax=Microbacterium sp. BWR-S6Y TaxID=3232073 RepID=UPI0035277ECA